MTVIPLGFMLVSLVVMAVIVFRKFGELSLLDVSTIPEVREGEKKREFLKRHIEKRLIKGRKIRLEQWKPVLKSLRDIQLRFRKYVGRIERMIVKERFRKDAPIQSRAEVAAADTELRTLLNDALFAFQESDVALAEKKYIAAIRLDPKNADAYLGLGDVYRKQGQMDEARETYQFVVQLQPANDEACMKLGDLFEEEGKKEDAIVWYEKAVLINDSKASRFAKLAELLFSIEQYPAALEAILQAVELESENPKYLDMMAETAILSGNKTVAERAYQDLRMVNSDNQKLALLKDKIEKMMAPP